MRRYCRNCYHPMPYKAKFCAHCGQRDSDGRTTMRGLLGKLWDTTFHLESKFVRSCWHLFIPGKVVTEFFKGKLGRYPHPLRFYAIVAFFFLFMVNYTLKNQEDESSKKDVGVHFTGDSTNTNIKINLGGKRLYEAGKHYAIIQQMREHYDSLPLHLRTPQANVAFDSVLHQMSTDWQTKDMVKGIFTDGDTATANVLKGLDTVPLSLGFHTVRVKLIDIFKYEPDEIIQRYHLTDWKSQVVVRQGIKSIKDPTVLVHAYLGSLTWVILALATIMAGLLRLLYWRQRRYYVEHFLFILHHHSAIMLAFTILLIINSFAKLWPGVWVLVAAWFMIEPFFAMRRFYKQSLLKTFIKFNIFSFVHAITLVLLFVAGLFIVIVMF